jgi:hypothetical protein
VSDRTCRSGSRPARRGMRSGRRRCAGCPRLVRHTGMDFVVDTVEQTLINNVHLIDVVQTDPQPLMSDALDQLRQTCLRSCILSMTAWASSAAPCGSTDTDDRLSVTVTAARTPARSPAVPALAARYYLATPATAAAGVTHTSSPSAISSRSSQVCCRPTWPGQLYLRPLG